MQEELKENLVKNPSTKDENNECPEGIKIERGSVFDYICTDKSGTKFLLEVHLIDGHGPEERKESELDLEKVCSIVLMDKISLSDLTAEGRDRVAEKTKCDNQNEKDYAIMKAVEQAVENCYEKAVSVAKDLLADGISMAQVIKSTGLSEGEIVTVNYRRVH